MDDTISRKAAIDAVEWGITLAIAVNTTTGEKRQLFREGNNALRKAAERIKELPSAQPTQCNSGNILRHPQCANRTNLGNCDPVGGFCNSVPKEICDAQPQRTGRWEIYVISMLDGEGCRCSECSAEGAPYWDFCPNCGSYNGGNQEDSE